MLPEDLLKYVFGFLEEDGLFRLRKVCKYFKKNAALQVLLYLKIKSCNKYLLSFNPDVFKNLKTLDCCNNQLTEIPNIYGLIELYCNDNLLKKIPNITELKELWCSRNQITEIPNINKLKKLWCSNNLLTEIPHIIGLEELCCYGNMLEKIPQIKNCKIYYLH